MLSTDGQRLRDRLEAASRDLFDWVRWPASDPKEDREEGCVLLLKYHIARKAWRDYARLKRSANSIPGSADSALETPPR